MQLLLAIPMGAQAVGGFARIQTYLQHSETSVSKSTDTSTSIGTNAGLTAEKKTDLDPKDLVQHPQQSEGNYRTGNDQTAFPALHFAANSITAITGPIGCGKSTILKGLLSPDGIKKSCLSASTDIAYCSQTPWIYEGTIRDNIIGQAEWDNNWYQSVVRACELEVDFSNMPQGDSTTVGSRGSRLSGGQRQRIVSGDKSKPGSQH